MQILFPTGYVRQVEPFGGLCLEAALCWRLLAPSKGWTQHSADPRRGSPRPGRARSPGFRSRWQGTPRAAARRAGVSISSNLAPSRSMAPAGQAATKPEYLPHNEKVRGGASSALQSSVARRDPARRDPARRGAAGGRGHASFSAPPAGTRRARAPPSPFPVCAVASRTAVTLL